MGSRFGHTHDQRATAARDTLRVATAIGAIHGATSSQCPMTIILQFAASLAPLGQRVTSRQRRAVDRNSENGLRNRGPETRYGLRAAAAFLADAALGRQAQRYTEQRAWRLCVPPRARPPWVHGRRRHISHRAPVHRPVPRSQADARPKPIPEAGAAGDVCIFHSRASACGASGAGLAPEPTRGARRKCRRQRGSEEAEIVAAGMPPGWGGV